MVEITRQYANGETDPNGSRLHIVELDDGFAFKMPIEQLKKPETYEISGRNSEGRQRTYTFRINNGFVTNAFVKNGQSSL